MKVLIVSPYHGGSHKAWAEGYSQTSVHKIDLLTMPARFWKWRMHGGAVTLARRFLASKCQPDVLVATDMLDLATFLALTRTSTATIPAVLYMHENQLTYPLPEDRHTGPMRRQLGERDRHYAFINYASMLVADEIWFNSNYHLDIYFTNLPNFLKHFPEYNELGTVNRLRHKSRVMPVGVDFERLKSEKGGPDSVRADVDAPLILWNQRWEYDKNPRSFFKALEALAGSAIPFRVALCGQQYGKQPPVFSEWIDKFGDHVVHAGYADAENYKTLLWKADVAVSTAIHEFFGISILEAIYAQTFPLLPARLSYPELLPRAYHSTCLYENQADLVDRLSAALINANERKSVAVALAKSVAQFDWRSLAPAYDAGLESLAD